MFQVVVPIKEYSFILSSVWSCVLQMLSEVGWKISSNNLNWTNDASAGKAMFGDLRWLGVGLLRCGCRCVLDFRCLVWFMSRGFVFV